VQTATVSFRQKVLKGLVRENLGQKDRAKELLDRHWKDHYATGGWSVEEIVRKIGGYEAQYQRKLIDPTGELS
jgi:hypothetical protein